jgi:peptidyl-tRNA hydrolase, PTH1 family
MWLVVGLGNPGTKYILTRHNIGFMVLDVLCQQAGGTWKNEHNADVLKTTFEKTQVILAKPQTFMNRSGESVQPLASFYKIPPENIIVAQDEVDLPFGGIKFQIGRSAGGHNGIKSVTEKLGTDKYYRLRIGVGRPAIPQMDTADFVLQNFSKEEQKQVPQILEHCFKGIMSLFEFGYNKTASLYNKNIFESA